ncbi:MAG: ATP-binding cassette domain-containing protein [Candidatus Firestonebacteria bacterium]|nr:ATP-binding cassette domain-containing protein [Candidatus Firestonebacteria bacterium]
MNNNMDKIISIKELSFTYRNTQIIALKNISLDIFSNEFIVLMGANGAGKSSFCYTLNGLIPHFIKGELIGKVIVQGRDTHEYKVKDFAQTLGFVFQDFETQLFSTKVELEVAFGCENLCLSPEEIKKRIHKALEFTHLENLIDRQPETLSGGQKQRLAIASILAMEPEIILFDESTTDLDPIGKADLFELGYKLRQEGKKTLIMVEHETEEAVKADRIIILNEGKIEAIGTPREILSKIDLIRNSGIMPVKISELFHRLGEYELPFTIEEAEEKFKKNNYKIDENKYQLLIEKEKLIPQNYGSPIIEIRNLQFKYLENNPVLKNINLTIRQGEFIAILGQNGSGKTTLVKHFNGLLLPSSGEVLVNGENTSSVTVENLSRIIGYVFQNPDHQIFAERVYDDVAFGPQLHGFSDLEVKRNVEEALKAVGLFDFQDNDPFVLTKGQRQKIAVASILATKPKVIILDEPTTGLDYKELLSMMDLLKRLNKAGHTIIIVTHSMWIAGEYAHRAVIIKEGEIYIEGTMREVFAQEEKLTKAFLKPPSMVSLSNRFGKTMMSVDEAASCIYRG